MRLLRNALLGLSALVAAHASPAMAGFLLPIAPVAGSVAGGTGVFGITDNGTIVGNWFDSNNVEHGYFGTLAGRYTKFDAGPGGTEPRGIDNAGAIVGYYNASEEVDGGQAFERNRNGVVSDITKNGVQLIGIVQGISAVLNDAFVGDYYQVDTSGNFTGLRFGFVGYNGRWLANIPLPASAAKPAPRGINDLGTVVGYFVSNSTQHGFILQNATLTQVDYSDPNAQGTNLQAVNDSDLAVGQWTDANGNSHSFTYDIRSSRFTPINVPGATDVQAFGLNNFGMIAVNTDTASFIYCPLAFQCQGSGWGLVTTTETSTFVPPEQMPAYVCAQRCTSIRVTSASQARRRAAAAPTNTHWRLYARP
jgi:hypothetical protein